MVSTSDFESADLGSIPSIDYNFLARTPRRGFFGPVFFGNPKQIDGIINRVLDVCSQQHPR